MIAHPLPFTPFRRTSPPIPKYGWNFLTLLQIHINQVEAQHLSAIEVRATPPMHQLIPARAELSHFLLKMVFGERNACFLYDECEWSE
jgi:hypothetical protein